eukprot:15060315-Heterocapsa_arctica.AAC.1
MDAGCRGWFFPDPAHRRYDSFQNAVSEVDLSFIKFDASVILNLGSGPWGSCAHFCKYSEAATEYFSNFSHEDPLFQIALPFIVHRFKAGQATEQHNPEFENWVWQVGAECELFVNKGAKAQQNRWFQWTRRWRQMKENIGFLLLVLLYQGLTLGWWPTLEESPFRRLVQQPAEAAVAELGGDGGDGGDAGPGPAERPAAGGPDRAGHVDPQAAAAGVDRSVGGSNRGLDKWTGKRNALQVAADILCNPATLALTDMISLMSEPIDQEHGLTLTMMKTPRGSHQGVPTMENNIELS